MKTILPLVAISLLILFPACASTIFPEKQDGIAPYADNDNDKTNWSGYYRQESILCTTSQGDGSCGIEVEDCLSISKESSETYKVNLLSVQAYQNICAFSVEMTQTRDSLVYKDPSGGEITIKKTNGFLIIQTSSLSPSDPMIGFCGQHGSLNGLKFETSRSTESTKGECPAP